MQNEQINNNIVELDFGSASANLSTDFNYFQKPKSLILREFFDFQPNQSHLTHLFYHQKLF
jgi:hypothetical protein